MINEDIQVVGFPKLGLNFEINKVAFSILEFKVFWYGIIIAIGVALAVVYTLSKSKKVGLDSDKVIDIIIVGFIGAVIGARMYFVAFSFSEYKDNLLKIFDIRGGGLAIYGGLIFAVITGLLMCKLRKVKMAPMLDIAGLGFLIGQCIGRWANFVNVEAYGSPTTLPWGMSSPSITSALADRFAVPTSGQLMVHPTFLYESLWCLLGFLLLNKFLKHRKYDGQIFLMYLVWYGTERFFVEGLRTDSLYIGNSPLRVSQLVSALIVIAAIATMIIISMQRKANPIPLYVDTEESKKMLAIKWGKKEIDAYEGEDDANDGGSSDYSFDFGEEDVDEVDSYEEETEKIPNNVDGKINTEDGNDSGSKD